MRVPDLLRPVVLIGSSARSGGHCWALVRLRRPVASATASRARRSSIAGRRVRLRGSCAAEPGPSGWEPPTPRSVQPARRSAAAGRFRRRFSVGEGRPRGHWAPATGCAARRHAASRRPGDATGVGQRKGWLSRRLVPCDAPADRLLHRRGWWRKERSVRAARPRARGGGCSERRAEPGLCF